jgi:rod shape-determining protein MreB
MTTGLPKTLLLSSSETEEALRLPLENIISAVKTVLEKTPPELVADVAQHGILMTGGGCLLYGLDELITEKTGIMTNRAPDPITAVAIGTGKYVEIMAEKNSRLK